MVASLGRAAAFGSSLQAGYGLLQQRVQTRQLGGLATAAAEVFAGMSRDHRGSGAVPRTLAVADEPRSAATPRASASMSRAAAPNLLRKREFSSSSRDDLQELERLVNDGDQRHAMGIGEGLDSWRRAAMETPGEPKHAASSRPFESTQSLRNRPFEFPQAEIPLQAGHVVVADSRTLRRSSAASAPQSSGPVLYFTLGRPWFTSMSVSQSPSRGFSTAAGGRRRPAAGDDDGTGAEWRLSQQLASFLGPEFPRVSEPAPPGDELLVPHEDARPDFRFATPQLGEWRTTPVPASSPHVAAKTGMPGAAARHSQLLSHAGGLPSLSTSDESQAILGRPRNVLEDFPDVVITDPARRMAGGLEDWGRRGGLRGSSTGHK